MPARIICATGPESTGKTTLCQGLAEVLGAPWLGEYARAYLAERRDYDAGDLAAIAREQCRREDELVARSAPAVVLDTDLSVILIWWRAKFGEPPDWLVRRFEALPPRLYLLCRPDLPWQPDPLRETGGDRRLLRAQFAEYQRLLRARAVVVVRGRGDRRLALARQAARRWLDDRPTAPGACAYNRIVGPGANATGWGQDGDRMGRGEKIGERRGGEEAKRKQGEK